MKKIIKLPIESTTQIRKTEDSLCELYSHDKNNGLFEFEVTNVKLGDEKPYAMFKFMDSLSVWKVLGTIEDNKIKVAFDTSLITKDETVVCFLYLDDEERTTDFYRFKFKVKVSEIDKINTYAVKERYFNNSIIVDKVDVVTKDELKEALKGLTVSTVEGVLTETRADEIYAKKSDITQPYDDSALRQRVATLEERPDNNTVYDDSDLRGRVVALETKADNDTVYDDTDLKRRVSDLENKSDKDTVYDDSDLRGRVEALEERPTTTAYDDTDVKRRLTNLEERPDNNTVYDDTDVKNRLKAIEDTQISKETLKDYVKTVDLPAPYNDQRVNERLEALESKTDNDTVYNDTDLKNRVEALENRPTTSVTAYDDSDLKRRVSELEQRPDNNTVYDDTNVKERLTALETKEDKDTKYDDSALTQRVEALESKPEGASKEDVKGLTDRVVALENKEDHNTIYDDTALSNRVKALEDAPKVNITDFATKNDLVAFNGELNNKVSSVDFEELKKTIPAPYNDKALSDRVLALENRPSTGGGVQTQDTGWIKLSDETMIAGNIVEIRRIDNTVHVRFRNEQGNHFIVNPQAENNTILTKQISTGFGSVVNNSLMILNENKSKSLGVVSTEINNGNLQITIHITNSDYSNEFGVSVYVNEFTYITDEPFPTNLH